jgi:signal transduction histidine kinase
MTAAADPVPAEALVRQLAEALILLDAEQRVLSCDTRSDDLTAMAEAMDKGIGRYWTDFVSLADSGHRQPLHWRLLDDASLHVAGSARTWRARLFPLGQDGFELLLVPDTIDALPHNPPSVAVADPEVSAAPGWNGLLGRDLAPALRQPVSRIIANAETIRTRLAGPLADEYSAYAADIAEAGRHLLALIEDLADLEAVEAPDFTAAPDPIDLSDCARRAAGILSVRAQERSIALVTPPETVIVPAIGEFRRVLQVLLNLLSNAIRYTPGNSSVAIDCGINGSVAWIAVSDQGEGLSQQQADRVFDKFERLGRSGDGGSGLGLYISRRLARAMGGDLSVDAATGQGARFVLTLPADESRTAG